MKTITNLLFGLLLISTASCQENRVVRVTVTEEDGSLIEGADVGVYYLAYNTDKDKEVDGKTDAQGVFSAKYPVKLRMEVSIHKKGYYPTHSGRLSRKQDHDVTFVLRKKKNPIPLHAKRLQVAPPVNDKNLGYDFEVGDWVAPHGEGKHSDVFFNVHQKKTDFWNYVYRLKVSFPNKHDGIQQFTRNHLSVFKSPYQAPERGYKPEWLQTSERKGKDSAIISNIDSRRGHWIRVRTEVDNKGRIVSANYVKVYGDFPDVRYYFNPTPNDRNLEFDPQKNLFQNLDSTEQVREP